MSDTDTDTVEETSTAPGYDYDALFQRKIVALSLLDPKFAARTDGLIDPKYLENAGDAFLVKMAQDFYKKYRKVPDKASLVKLLKDALVASRIGEEDAKEIKTSLRSALGCSFTDRDYVIDVVSDFARHRAVEEAIIRSVDLKEKGDFATIEKIMRQALQVGAIGNGNSYDYWEEIDSRTEYRKAMLEGKIKPEGITTGFPDLDKHLYHGGWGKKELSVIMGAAKFGKSMGLGDFGKNASLAGHNVLILTCEMSAKIYADRIDANLSETAMDLLKHKPTLVRDAIKKAEAKAGKIIIEDFPSNTLKPSMMRRVIEYHRNRGIKFDMCVMDYLDIFAPEHPTGIPREDSRLIWLDSRAIMQEEDLAGLSGTQTNRDGAKATVAGATDVAEDYNKIRTADLVISGNATETEKKANKARLHFAASRNQKEITVEIEQDRNTMRFLKKVLGVIL